MRPHRNRWESEPFATGVSFLLVRRIGEEDGCRLITFGRGKTVSGRLQHLRVCRAGAAASSLLSVVQLGQHQPSSGAMVLVGNKTAPTVVVRVITSGNIDVESIYVCQALLLVL